MYLTYADIQEKFGVSSKTVRRWVKAGQLRSLKLGYRTTRFRLADVEAFERKLLTMGHL